MVEDAVPDAFEEPAVFGATVDVGKTGIAAVEPLLKQDTTKRKANRAHFQGLNKKPCSLPVAS